MRIAIPVAGGRLCMHFGHCEQFAMVDVDPAEKKILGKSFLTPPPHEPGLLPRWLAEKGATCIIAGGMGSRAQGLFREANITVITGAQPNDPEMIIQDLLNERLELGVNSCDH